MNFMIDTIIIGGDLPVTRIGLGTNRFRKDDRSAQALKAAVALGINFIDTASSYTNGQSEEIIGETLSPYNNAIIATKGGMVAPDFHIDSRPATLKQSLEMSLKRLKLKTIDLYFLHRVDPNTPFKESLLFLKQMQNEGKIKHIGLSEVSIEQIEEARKYIIVAAIENHYNISEQRHDDVVTYCEKEQIVFIPYFPLRFTVPHSQTVAELQQTYNATTEQLALAWLLKRSPIILPIPGSLSAKHLEENVAALKIKLNDKDFEKLSQAAS